MKNYFLSSLAVLTMLSSLHSFAGAGGGNGGDVIVCPNQRTVLLDKYEALKRGFKIELPGKTLRAKVLDISERLKKLDPFNGKNVQETALKMVSDLELYRTNPEGMSYILMSTDILRDIDDSLETAIPKGCVKEQLVINKSLVYAHDRKFEMRSDLWDQMELEDQALTVMHEAIYNWLRNYQEDSRLARYLNGYFAQSESKIQYGDYFISLKTAGAPLFVEGVTVDGRFNLYGYDEVEDGMVYINRSGNVGVISFISVAVRFGHEQITLPSLKNLVIDRSGQVQSGTAVFNGYSRGNDTYVHTFKLSNGEVKFKSKVGGYDVEVSFDDDRQVTQIQRVGGLSYVLFNGKKYSDVRKVIIKDGEIRGVQ